MMLLDQLGRQLKEGDVVVFVDGRVMAFEVKEISVIQNTAKMVCEMLIPLDPKGAPNMLPALRCITKEELGNANAPAPKPH